MVSRSFFSSGQVLPYSPPTITPISWSRRLRASSFSSNYLSLFSKLALLISLLFLLSAIPVTQAEDTRFLGVPAPDIEPENIYIYSGQSFMYQFHGRILEGFSIDHLGVILTLHDGGALPTWMTFNSQALILSGVAPREMTSLMLKLTVTDGLHTKNYFYRVFVDSLGFDFVHKDFVVAVNKQFTIQLLSTSIKYTDNIQVKASLITGEALPEWIKFIPNTFTFLGKASAPSTLNIKLDMTVEAMTATRHITIRINPELILKYPIPDQLFLLTGEPVVFRIPDQTFEGFAYRVEAKPLDLEEFPSWISFDSNNREFIIKPHLDNSQGLAIQVTAKDEAEQTAVCTFRIVTRNVQYIMPKLSPRTVINHINIPTMDPKLVSTLIKDKGVFMAWQSINRFNSYISAAVVDFAGNNIIPEFIVTDIKAGTHGRFVRNPKLAQFSNQDLFIMWETSDTALRGKIIDWKNTIKVDEFEICGPTQNIEYVDAYPLGENVLILTTLHQPKHLILGHIVGPNGSIIKQDITLSETYSEVISPKLTILPSGNVILTYIERDFSSKKVQVTAILLDNDLTLTKSVVLYSALEWIYKLDSLLLSTGNIMLAWTATSRMDPVSTKLSAIIINEDLEIVKAKFTLANMGTTQPTYPSLMTLQSGEILAIWDNTLAPGAQGTTLNAFGEVIRERVTLYNPKHPGEDRAKLVSLGNSKALIILMEAEGHFSNIVTQVVDEKFQQNMIPDLLGNIPNQVMYQENPFQFVLPNFLFVDYDGEPVKVTLTMADRTPLPKFIHYNIWNRSLTIDPEDAVRGNYVVLARGEDPHGAFVEVSFTIKIVPHPVKYFVCILILCFSGVLLGAYIYRRIQLKRSYNMLQISAHRNTSSAKSSESSKDPTPITRADIEMLMSFTTDKIPNSFICPITGELMSDPYMVLTEEGPICHTYEKEALDKWFVNNETDPMTRRTMIALASNITLKTSIELFVKGLTVEDLVNDKGLYLEIEKWIKRRGKRNLLNDINLRHIVERYQEARAILKENKELHVIVNFEKKLVY